MGDNEIQREDTGAERKRHGCLIAFLIFFVIFVAPIIIFIALLFYACHKEYVPDLSDYHLSGDTVVLSGEEFDYHITYESLSVEYDPWDNRDVKIIKLSIAIDEGVELPDVLYFYTKNKISRIESNHEEGEIYKMGSIFADFRIKVSMRTNPCEVDLFCHVDDFKGYIKFGLTKVQKSLDAHVGAIEFELY